MAIFKGPVKIGKYVVVDNNPQLKELTIEGDTHNHYYTDNSNNATQVNAVNQPSANPLSAKAVEKYVQAGLLTPDLMPADGLSRGEIAVLAHDIAERHGMQRFWPVFEKKWELRYLSSDYNRFAKTQKFVGFQKRLNSL